MPLKVCIIGAGVCGLAATKTCLEENLQVDCYEQTSDIGGLWRFREECVSGEPSIMRNALMYSNKEVTAFSDFPPDQEFPNFMPNSIVLKYLQNYAEHFDLRKHIKLEHEIIKIDQSEKYDNTGQWTVKVKNKEGIILELLYDAVMVCSGHHTFPHMPVFPDMEQFEGRVIHSRCYKDNKQFENKKILLVGTGNSAVDAALELQLVSKQIYISTRRGSWISMRTGNRGIPLDLQIGTRFHNFLIHRILPQSLANIYFERKVKKFMDHEFFCLKPDHRFLSQHITIGDELPNAILSGRIKIKGDILRFTKKGVIFEGDVNEHEIDDVILGTGYIMQLPFIDKNLLEFKNNIVDLYKLIFPPNFKHPTLAVIGFLQPSGSMLVTSEIQSRWVAKIFTKHLSLPSTEEMIKDIVKVRQKISDRFIHSMRHSVDTNYLEYVNEIANSIGVKPNFWKMLMKDPVLWYFCIFGPFVGYQFRLQGTHAWSGARKAILTVSERVKYPLQTRKKKNSINTERNPFSLFMLIIIVLILLFCVKFTFNANLFELFGMIYELWNKILLIS